MSVVEVAIGHGGSPGKFRVDVLRSPAGEASAEVSLDTDMLLRDRGQFQQTLLVSGVAARRALSEEEREVRGTGQALFAALLGSGEVAGRYRASSALAEQRDEELRIVLRLDAPELAALPWEAMYDAGTGGYVCRQHQLVRHVPVAAVPPPLSVRPPLRVLGVVSAPRGLMPLDSAREREQLTEALAGLSRQGLAELAWAPEATWAGLHEMLLAGPWHVLHFIGHGDFDPDRDEGVLALTRENGRADLVEASRFADLLRQARPMPRLVVLNSCSGAATSQGDLFSGTAAALARSGVAAVTAMQYAISDIAALAFARGFYAALARGRGVDEAVSAGRIGILGTSGQTLEWITPVMYLRGHDAHLFTRPPANPEPTPMPGNAAPAPPDNQVSTPARTADPVPAKALAAPIPSRWVRTLSGHTGLVYGVAFSPDGTLIATVSDDDTAVLWDVATGRTVRALTGHTRDIAWVAFSPDGTLLATSGTDGMARLWDVATGHTVRVLTGHTGHVFGVAFSPDGSLLATGSADQRPRLWDVATGQSVRTLTGHTGTVIGVAFSPDGTLLATGSHDGMARLWDVGTGHTIRTFTGHTDFVYGVAFSPDGSLLATGSADQRPRLWDVATGQSVRTFTGHTSGVVVVAFSPDGTFLATSGGEDKTVRLWDVATGQTVHTLTGHTDAVRGVAFSPDGALLATGSEDNTVRLWA
jgi:sugar lactone lactonase YvrE